MIPGMRFLPACALLLLLLPCCTTPKPAHDAPAHFLPRGWCFVDAVAPTVRVELKYAGGDNFVGRPIAGYTGRRAVLRRDAAEALARAAAALEKEGLGLLIWDAYRPTGALRDIYAWSQTPDTRMRQKFYPNITKRGIYEGRYIGLTSEHSWGIAVDITLVELATGRELDMGGHHDLLDPSSATHYTGISAQQQANRHKLWSAMRTAGFRNYSKEWWHYFLSGAEGLEAYGFPLDDSLPDFPAAR